MDDALPVVQVTGGVVLAPLVAGIDHPLLCFPPISIVYVQLHSLELSEASTEVTVKKKKTYLRYELVYLFIFFLSFLDF